MLSPIASEASFRDAFSTHQVIACRCRVLANARYLRRRRLHHLQETSQPGNLHTVPVSLPTNWRRAGGQEKPRSFITAMSLYMGGWQLGVPRHSPETQRRTWQPQSSAGAAAEYKVNPVKAAAANDETTYARSRLIETVAQTYRDRLPLFYSYHNDND